MRHSGLAAPSGASVARLSHIPHASSVRAAQSRPKPASSSSSIRCRAATDGPKPWMRRMVALSLSRTAAGKWAAAATSACDPIATDIARTASASVRPGNTSVTCSGGRGMTLSVSSVSANSRPQLCAASFERSKPVTFFTTLPPAAKISARPETARKPNRWSRAPPPEIRPDPATPADTMPPIVALPAASPKIGPWSNGSKAKNCDFAASRETNSASGVPGLTVSTNSAGS